MNKVLKGIVCIVLAAAFAAGGYFVGRNENAMNILPAIPQKTIDENKPSVLPEKTPEPEKDAGKYIGKSEASAVEATWPEVDSFECDMNGDGKEEKIGLYTSAEKDGEEILWNDMQKWVLEVKTDGGYYILLNQNVSNGHVYFDVDESSDGTKAIMVYTVSTTGTVISRYVYSKTGFVEQAVYGGEAMNKMHTGIPSYK